MGTAVRRLHKLLALVKLVAVVFALLAAASPATTEATSLHLQSLAVRAARDTADLTDQPGNRINSMTTTPVNFLHFGEQVPFRTRREAGTGHRITLLLHPSRPSHVMLETSTSGEAPTHMASNSSQASTQSGRSRSPAAKNHPWEPVGRGESKVVGSGATVVRPAHPPWPPAHQLFASAAGGLLNVARAD